jgi:hypothetical protein
MKKKSYKVNISKFLKVTSFMNTVFKSSEFQKHSRIKIYNAVNLLTYLCGSENWPVKAEDKTRFEAMK